MREKQELLRGVKAFAANMLTLLIEWKQELDAVENTERRTAKGKKIVATFKQCVRYEEKTTESPTSQTENEERSSSNRVENIGAAKRQNRSNNHNIQIWSDLHQISEHHPKEPPTSSSNQVLTTTPAKPSTKQRRRS
ncbi:hypothetical protein Bca4012_098363 [Brassica carinata]|uniref:Uncharacterized protein n=1 Tax=Brassica carinata TaxID=52824 RepID=A0A8X7PH92_BRACI|nr:hypothetical protein Bca52824_081048 [Brassica carinata]